MFYVYVLYSSTIDRYYIGMTINIIRRLNEHNSKKTPSTRIGIPWIVVHQEVFETRIADYGSEGYRFESCRGHNLRISLNNDELKTPLFVGFLLF